MLQSVIVVPCFNILNNIIQCRVNLLDFMLVVDAKGEK